MAYINNNKPKLLLYHVQCVGVDVCGLWFIIKNIVYISKAKGNMLIRVERTEKIELRFDPNLKKSLVHREP